MAPAPRQAKAEPPSQMSLSPAHVRAALEPRSSRTAAKSRLPTTVDAASITHSLRALTSSRRDLAAETRHRGQLVHLFRIQGNTVAPAVKLTFHPTQFR